MDVYPPAAESSLATTSAAALPERTSSTKRKRCRKTLTKRSTNASASPPEPLSPSTSDDEVEPLSYPSTSVGFPTMAAATVAAPVPPPHNRLPPLPPSPRLEPAPASTWLFITNPVLRLLPKWPAAAAAASTVTADDSEKAPILAASNPPPKGSRLQLLLLLDIPPIAASIASHLYGHDLLNLRCLNSTFYSLLSAETPEDRQRPYYHALLLKSLLCPREDVTTEPKSTACKSAGGNVGPCIFCKVVICSTCISPEIWTNRRYRYICPACTSKPVDNANRCDCQTHIWVCRGCYNKRWVKDLHYDASWASAEAITCELCRSSHSQKTDGRLPHKPTPPRKTLSFSNWMTSAKPIVSKHAKGKKRTRLDAVSNEESKQRRRPVACAWCVKRIDPGREDWTMRPEKIRRGEEKGRWWILELERRRREREGEGGDEEGTSGGEGGRE